MQSPRCKKFADKQFYHFKATKQKMALATSKSDDYCEILRSKKDEKLPIVEVRPFTTQVWRKAKSYPGHQLGPHIPRSQTAVESPRKELSNADYGFPNPAKIGSINRDVSPCSRAQTSVNGRLSKTKSAKTFKENTYFSVPPRGFATLGERCKTTLDEIKSGENSNTYYSLLNRARSEMDLSEEKNIRLQGQKMTEGEQKKCLYSEPWQYYLNHRVNAQENGTVKDDLMLRIEHVANVYQDGAIYDAFERSQTLPSIKIKQTSLRKRRKRNDQRNQSASAGAHVKKGHRLGVKNTLDVLSQKGKPIGLEDQLFMQLRNTLHRLRTTKSINGLSLDHTSNHTSRIERSVTVDEMNSGRVSNKKQGKVQHNNFVTSRSASTYKPYTGPRVTRANTENLDDLSARFGKMDVSKDVENQGDEYTTKVDQQSKSQDQVIETVQDSNKSTLNDNESIHVPITAFNNENNETISTISGNTKKIADYCGSNKDFEIQSSNDVLTEDNCKSKVVEDTNNNSNSQLIVTEIVTDNSLDNDKSDAPGIVDTGYTNNCNNNTDKVNE